MILQNHSWKKGRIPRIVVSCVVLYADDVLREHIRASVTTLASTLANLTAISLASHLLSSIRIIIINNNSSNTHSQ